MNRERKNDVKFSISLTEEQREAKGQIMQHPVSFVEGRAGSGKTLLAANIGLDMVFSGLAKKIVITRPTITTEDNGFLPGTIDDKMEPWIVPLRDNMRKVYNKPEKLKAMERDGEIELVSLSFFRGRSFEDAVCIIDEYQNLTTSQLSMVIGRLGKNSIMIFCGDDQQIDLKRKSDSAVFEASKIKHSPNVYTVFLKDNHRHSVVAELLELLK